MTNQNYWAKRTAEREAQWHDLTTAELAKLRRYYKAAAKELEREAATLYAKYATENGLTITEARKLIRGDEFKEWRMSLREYVAAAKGDPKLLRELNTLAMRSRISRVEAIHARTLTELIELGNRLQDTTDEHLYRAYLDNYYGTLYDFHKTVGLQTPPAAVDRPRVESVLQTKWSGKNYSARIWTNTRKLATELQSTITQAIHRGYSIQRLSKNLAQRMNVAYTNAERLILTELNAVETRASADAMKAADFEYYQFVATLDRRTCPICGERDGEVYPLSSMNQGENAPPIHPRCRCTIVASIDDGKQGRKTTDQRAAEGRSRVPADMSYRDWQAVYIEAGIESRSFEEMRKYIGKLDDVTARKWYKWHDENIHTQIDAALPLEQKARLAFDLRNEYRTQTRELMADQAKRRELDEKYPNPTWEEILRHKIEDKGMTYEQALEDVYQTATKSNSAVNRSLGLG